MLDIYNVVLTMQSVGYNMLQLTRLMNMSGDSIERKRISEKVWTLAESARQKQQNGEMSTFAADQIPINLENVSFCYGAFQTKKGASLENCCGQILQGKLVAVIGPSG